MYTFISRTILVLISMICGFIAGGLIDPIIEQPYNGILGAGLGALAAAFVILIIDWAKRNELRVVIAAAIGLFLGIIAANILTFSLIFERSGSPTMQTITLYILVNITMAYMGAGIGARKGGDINFNVFRKANPDMLKEVDYKILDTSVIIDGRIADLCETGFIEGTIQIPQFVLLELQNIADSSDPIKRTRGRRGLDILRKLQKQHGLEVEIIEIDFPKIREVDSKLIALAQKNGGKIITNDFNLNKVAELQGVDVLNINQLANALKPVVLPGEIMNVRVLKEGKEEGQGVAYLDDGTMVVVDNARHFLGKNVDVSVTSVLQTTAGRMIFTVLKEEASERYNSHPGRGRY